MYRHRSPTSNTRILLYLFLSNFHEDNEGLINRQINLELYASYVYTAMSHHFDRSDVALKGKTRSTAIWLLLHLQMIDD
jgi:hypothetical protein